MAISAHTPHRDVAMSQEAGCQERPPLAQDLASAFQLFTQVSEQLAASYRVLEDRVVQLTSELATARSERLAHFTEKEYLADRFEHLLNALPGGVVVLDGAGYVQECNPAAIELLGAPLHSLRWLDVIDRTFAPRSDDGHEVSLRDGRKVGISTCSLDSHRENSQLGGAQPGQILLINDLTETRALQEQLARHQRLSSMGEMAASLAHQIRTPLSSAMLYTSNLFRGDLDAVAQRRFSEKSLASLRHIEKMVNDMLMFARGGALNNAVGHGLGSAASSEVSIPTLINEFRHVIEPQLQCCAGTLEVVDATISSVSPAYNTPYLNGNKDALLAALLNLATNAIQACGHDVLLRLKITSDSQAVYLQLSDNGPGIPAQIRDRIFEPFFTTRSSGTGLGLAVVRAVVQGHHGEIWLDSTLDVGCSFTIRLPVTGPAAHQEVA